MMLCMILHSMSWMLLSCLMPLSWVQGEKSQEELLSPCTSCPQESQAYDFYCYTLILKPQTWTNVEGTVTDESGWRWSSSDLLNYYNWERKPSVSADRGYCAALNQASGYQKWRDYYCDTLFSYVCKFKS